MSFSRTFLLRQIMRTSQTITSSLSLETNFRKTPVLCRSPQLSPGQGHWCNDCTKLAKRLQVASSLAPTTSPSVLNMPNLLHPFLFCALMRDWRIDTALVAPASCPCILLLHHQPWVSQGDPVFRPHNIYTDIQYRVQLE